MHLVEHRAPVAATAKAHLVLNFEARCKSRLRTRLLSGEEVGLFMERGTVLRGGDKLAAADGTIIEVVAAPEMLMEATIDENEDDPLLLAKVAYHLGNRHVAIQLLPGRLRFAADHVLGEMVRGLGLPVAEIEAPFEPESGAYGHMGAHPHGHSSDGEGSFGQTRPRIHDHFRK